MRIFCDGLSCKVLKNGYSILEKDVITGMLTDLKKQRLKISIEIMPNTEPDFAALETILLEFSVKLNHSTRTMTDFIIQI